MINKDTIKQLAPISIIIFLVILAWVFGIDEIINLDAIKSQRSELLDLAHNRPVMTAAAFIGIYII